MARQRDRRQLRTHSRTAGDLISSTSGRRPRMHASRDGRVRFVTRRGVSPRFGDVMSIGDRESSASNSETGQSVWRGGAVRQRPTPGLSPTCEWICTYRAGTSIPHRRTRLFVPTHVYMHQRVRERYPTRRRCACRHILPRGLLGLAVFARVVGVRGSAGLELCWPWNRMRPLRYRCTL